MLLFLLRRLLSMKYLKNACVKKQFLIEKNTLKEKGVDNNIVKDSAPVFKALFEPLKYITIRRHYASS